MGSHSKKRKKEKKRSRSRSRSSEHNKSRNRSHSSSRSRSRSPSHRSSKHKKHHRRSRSRSRSRSHEKHSHSRRASRSRSRERERSWERDRERTSKRRRSRSRSLTRRSRSKSAERRRRRSRSAEKRSKRSKSQERHKSPDKSSPKKSSRSGSQESTKVKKEKEDAEETDLNLNPAEAIQHKMRKALEAAASADAKLREQGLLSSVKQETLTHTEQLERDQILQGLESESFAPSSFVSSRDRQAQPTYLTKEQSHENAIFGGAELPNPAINGAQTYSYGIPLTYKKKGQLASKYLSESIDEKEKRWVEKLQVMRRQKMQANPEYFSKLLTINADSPT